MNILKVKWLLIKINVLVRGSVFLLIELRPNGANLVEISSRMYHRLDLNTSLIPSLVQHEWLCISKRKRKRGSMSPISSLPLSSPRAAGDRPSPHHSHVPLSISPLALSLVYKHTKMSHRAFTTRRHSRGMRRLRARPPPQKHRSSPVQRAKALAEDLTHGEGPLWSVGGAAHGAVHPDTAVSRDEGKAGSGPPCGVAGRSTRTLLEHSSETEDKRASAERGGEGRGASRTGSAPPPCPGELPASAPHPPPPDTSPAREL